MNQVRMLTWVTKKGSKNPSPKAYGIIKVTASKFIKPKGLNDEKILSTK